MPKAATVLLVEGGWSAVVRIPRTAGDEELVLDLVTHDGVAVYPGYFFDFDREGYIVVSLLTAREVFDEGVARIARAVGVVSR